MQDNMTVFVIEFLLCALRPSVIYYVAKKSHRLYCSNLFIFLYWHFAAVSRELKIMFSGTYWMENATVLSDIQLFHTNLIHNFGWKLSDGLSYPKRSFTVSLRLHDVCGVTVIKGRRFLCHSHQERSPISLIYSPGLTRWLFSETASVMDTDLRAFRHSKCVSMNDTFTHICMQTKNLPI